METELAAAHKQQEEDFTLTFGLYQLHLFMCFKNNLPAQCEITVLSLMSSFICTLI